MRIIFFIATILLIATALNRPAESAPPVEKKGRPVTPLAVHAHRYQDFQRNVVACEVFGEIKNTGDRPVISFTLHLEMLDAKGNVLTKEDLSLALRVIVPGNAKGELRAVKPTEIGNFIQQTQNCPEKWLEGRIKHNITAVQTE